LRQTVYSPPGEWTTLATEMEWARNYLGLEKLRFGERLDIGFSIDEAAAASRVPSFVLHPIVENAVKHGRRDAHAPLSIRITARRLPDYLEVVVANTGQLEQPADGAGNRHDDAVNGSRSTGIGLANIRERLKLLDRRRNRLALEQRGQWVEVTLQLDPS
jgi:LytS/YehU family sensor histidine kinase